MAGAIEKAAETKAAAPATLSTAQIVQRSIDAQGARFRAVLPAGFDSGRYQNLVLTAIKAKPQLMECFATKAGEVSVLLAAMEAAVIGLEPDTPMQEAWLLPRRNNGRMECQLSIGYQGYIKLARRTGEIKSLRANVVKDGDHFHYEYGLEEDVLEHRPAPSEQRGDNLYAYAIARYKDGGYDFVVLDRGEVEARRARSDSFKGSKPQYSPWTTAADSMWRKSAVRELAKWMPKSAVFAHAMSTEERTLDFADDGTIVPIDDGRDVDTTTGELSAPSDVVDAESTELPLGAG